MKVYIAGPMRGIAHYNFRAFDAARDRLSDDVITVVSPADLDRAAGFDPFTREWPEGWNWRDPIADCPVQDCIQRDFDALRTCNAIYMLDGWEGSVGARAEKALAEWCGLKVLYQTQPTVTAGEVRITSPTGGQKGSKLARFDLIPAEELWEVSEHYGRGAAKYSDDNWRKGYSWRLSFAALMRHAWAFWRGEERDAETGSHHLAAVVFHCLTLMWFGKHRTEFDDRPKAQATP